MKIACPYCAQCALCSITCSVRAPLTKSYNSAGRGGGCIVPSPCSFQTFVPLVNLYMLLLSCFCGLFPPSFSFHTRSFSVTFSSFLLLSCSPFLSDFFHIPHFFILALSQGLSPHASFFHTRTFSVTFSSFLIFSYLPFLRDFLLVPPFFILALSQGLSPHSFAFHIRIFALFSGPNLHSPSFILALSSDLILIPLFSYSPFYYFLSLSNSSIPWTLLLHIPYCSSSPFLLNSLTSFSFTCPFT